MEEEQKTTQTKDAAKTPATSPSSATDVAKKAPTQRAGSSRGGARGGQRGGGRDRRPRRGGRRPEREKPEFDQTIVELARVTRVTKGGKRLRFRCCLVIGDRKGRVGYGVAKGADVQIAVEKAYRQAKKNMITVPLVNGTIPFDITAKSTSAKVMLKPAPKGSGVIAGGALRTVFEYAGIPNISSKIMGSKNKINNIKATFVAFEELSSMLKHRK